MNDIATEDPTTTGAVDGHRRSTLAVSDLRKCAIRSLWDPDRPAPTDEVCVYKSAARRAPLLAIVKREQLGLTPGTAASAALEVTFLDGGSLDDDGTLAETVAAGDAMTRRGLTARRQRIVAAHEKRLANIDKLINAERAV